MKAFAKRAYFNSTHLGQDIVAFAEEAGVLATETVMDAKKRSIEYVYKQGEEVNKAIDPYTRPVTDLYRDYMSEHVKAAGDAIQPVYDKSIAPVVAEADLFRRQITNEFWIAFDDAFDQLVSLAKDRCKMSRKEIEAAPAMVRSRMQNVCKDPAAVIGDGLRMIVVLLIIIFRKTIWNLVWGTIKLTASSIWYIVSFGFLRSSSSNPPAIDTEEDTDDIEKDTDEIEEDTNEKLDEPQGEMTAQ